MKKLLFVALPLFMFSCKTSAQIGTVKTEEYQADFEKRQSMAVVSDYTDTIVIPIQVLKIGINQELYDMYPELKDKRVGLGVANIVLEYLESTDRFKFTEDREEIKQKMIAQDKASDKGISSNKIEDVLTVDASPKPLPVIISPVSASTNLTCKPNRVVCVALAPSTALTTSSSDTEKSYTSM